ncbi:potassium channel family protein [Pseudodesulfovibrio sp. zrk46]|uniref:potassium channel family protein n=1 Tax=Pseudodesulfovibrio sp. zrk46 TaxID=2725288 RepID=UPI001449C0EA|nr:potassium channel family protein [Pseudodesulfovibrio sp. zrk46]QJB56486.1 two pore domain potassium channel family protein [Pseudodesulfovibrio sp. zrk46]
MSKKQQSALSKAFLTHYVPSLFFGVVTLIVLSELFPTHLTADLNDNSVDLADISLAALNGSIVATAGILFHNRRNAYLKKTHAALRTLADRETLIASGIVGFLAGITSVILGAYNEGIIAMTLVVLTVLIWHLKSFLHFIPVMLKPGNVATWGDVSKLLTTYFNMLAGFTLVNATLEGIHIMVKAPLPFNFTANGGDIFINSLYYTVVTMTTLGFGDFVPQTWDGKLMLIFQCLVSYFMFALVIGIVTRGVVRSQEKINR